MPRKNISLLSLHPLVNQDIEFRISNFRYLISNFEWSFWAFVDILCFLSTVKMKCIAVILKLLFKPRSGHAKDYTFGVCCFSAKSTTLRVREHNGWLGIRIIVSDWWGMYTRGLLFQCWSRPNRTSSTSFHLNVACSRHDIAGKLLIWR